MNTVKIKIVRATVCGGVCVDAGDVVDATARDARLLLAMGKAVPAEVQTRDPGGNGDPDAEE